MKIKFKESTNKFVDDVDIIDKDIDIDLLIKKVNYSQFLKNAPKIKDYFLFNIIISKILFFFNLVCLS